jgi:hypothetical protein
MEEKEKRKGRAYLHGWQKAALVIILALAYGLGARIIFGSPVTGGFGVDVVSLSFLLGLPLSIGAITAFFMHDKPLRGFLLSMLIMAVVLGFTVFLALEIWICVLMVAVPMFLLAGAVFLVAVGCGWLWNKFIAEGEKPKRMNVFALFTFLLIPYIFVPIEAQFKSPDLYRTVEDSILITSSPELVWENIVRMDTITTEEQFPTAFQIIGIPRPIRATLREEGLGQLRRGYFEYGLEFQEVITVWEPYEEIRFTVRVYHNNLESPALAQIGGEYLDIVEAGYRIEDLGNGQIRLYLDSRYRVTTSFNDYAVLWADWIMHDFQSYVLRTVKARVEDLN